MNYDCSCAVAILSPHPVHVRLFMHMLSKLTVDRKLRNFIRMIGSQESSLSLMITIVVLYALLGCK